MMHDQRKIAMLIVKGLADSDKEYKPTEDQEVKTPDEHKKSDDSRMGVEVAMEKFMSAVKDSDTKKAVSAMMEFVEMCSGAEYYDKDDQSSKSMYGNDEEK